MFFFGSHKEALHHDNLVLLGGSSSRMISDTSKIPPRVWGEDHSGDVAALIILLVTAIHVGVILWLNRPEAITSEAKPLIMDVSMIRVAAPKPAVIPQPPAPPVEKKPLLKKTPPKVSDKKPPPIIQKAEDFAPIEPAKETPPPVSQPAASSSPTQPATSSSDQFTEANFRANYAQNPKPEYPAIARSRGWTGKVLLKVRVSAEGLAESVALEKTSGHDILDENAIEAVKQWRFIPAKRGETPVASSVIVPIDYKLNNN